MNDLIPDVKITGNIEIGGSNIYSPKTNTVELRRQVGMVFSNLIPFRFQFTIMFHMDLS